MAKSSKNKGTAPVDTNPVDTNPTPTPSTPEVATKPKRPERVVQHGVAQPREGGLCRAVWDYCAAQPTLPTVAQVKAHAAEVGWNPNNASIEYYQYRKFSGIRGRQAKPADTAATPADAG